MKDDQSRKRHEHVWNKGQTQVERAFLYRQLINSINRGYSPFKVVRRRCDCGVFEAAALTKWERLEEKTKPHKQQLSN
jgi:predicted secreted protein